MSLIRKPDSARGGLPPLITKPDASVFQDSTAVKVVRGSRAIAVEGGGAAARTVGKLWLGLMLVVFLLTGLGYLFMIDGIVEGVVYFGMMGGGVWLLVRMFRAPRRAAEEAIRDGADDPLCGISVELPVHLRTPAAAPAEGFHVDYWQRGLTEKASLLGVVGFIIMLVSGPFSFLGVLLVGRAALTVSPLLGNRACVVADEAGLTVHSLIGKQTVAWDKIDDVVLHKFAWRSLWVSISTGARKHLVVQGRRDFERVELLIPYQLLGLDQAGAKRLAERIMGARQGVSPRAAAAPRPLTVPASAPAAEAAGYRDTPEATFDPEAIMARYLAEREKVIEQAAMPRPGTQPAAARGFGRKGLAG